METLEIGMSTDRRYTIALCKGAALVDETRTLVLNWTPGEEVDHFVDRVLRDNVLARVTAYRTKDIVRRVFARRFLVPTDVPARRLRRLMDNGLPRKLFAEVLFLYAARADPLLYDFTTEVFWPACRRGRSILTGDDVVAFLAEATDRGRIEQPWSAKVQVKIARGVLSTLRDVGFLREERRGHREIVSYYLSDEGAAYLAYELHETGLSDSAMCEHPDWRLFGLDRGRVLGRLDNLAEDKGMLVQRAGSVVRITWKYESVEELIDGLA
jgi:hypothetical protein